MWLFRQKKTLAESGFFRGFTDCHSHLLPGIDDGVKTEEETWRILDEMERQGVRKIWLTPHVMEDMSNKTVTLQQKFLSLKQKYQGKVELALAAEYMLDNIFEERLDKDDLLPLERMENVICCSVLALYIRCRMTDALLQENRSEFIRNGKYRRNGM